MTCKKAAALLSQSIEHPLPWHRSILLRLHLLVCRYCRNYRRNLRFLAEAICCFYEGKRQVPSLREQFRRELNTLIEEET